MAPEQLTEQKAAESILKGIFEEREHDPDVFDAAGLISGALHNILGYREAYLNLKSQAEKQNKEGVLSSPQLTLMRHVKGLDRYNELEKLMESPKNQHRNQIIISVTGKD